MERRQQHPVHHLNQRHTLKFGIIGESGTGKSALARALAALYSLEHKSAGDFFREKAESMGITLLELEKLCETDPRYDYDVDQRTTEFGKERDDFVFDGRLAAECIPDAVKILLVCDAEVRYRRIAESRKMTLEQARHQTDTREASYRERFKRYYGITDYQDRRKYGFSIVIDTKQTSVDGAVRLVQAHLKEKGLCPAMA